MVTRVVRDTDFFLRTLREYEIKGTGMRKTLLIAAGAAVLGTSLLTSVPAAAGFGDFMNPGKWFGGKDRDWDDYYGPYGGGPYGYGYPGYGGYRGYGYPGYGYGGYPGYGYPGYGYPGYGGYPNTGGNSQSTPPPVPQ